MEGIAATLEWRGLSSVHAGLILIDDVITAGAHFKVCQSMIRQHHEALPGYGIFWGKAVWRERTAEEYGF